MAKWIIEVERKHEAWEVGYVPVEADSKEQAQEAVRSMKDTDIDRQVTDVQPSVSGSPEGCWYVTRSGADYAADEITEEEEA